MGGVSFKSVSIDVNKDTIVFRILLRDSVSTIQTIPTEDGLFLKTMTFFHRCLQNGTWSEILGCKQMSNVGKEGKRSILLTYP